MSRSLKQSECLASAARALTMQGLKLTTITAAKERFYCRIMTKSLALEM